MEACNKAADFHITNSELPKTVDEVKLFIPRGIITMFAYQQGISSNPAPALKTAMGMNG